jgi:hypothetical protein
MAACLVAGGTFVLLACSAFIACSACSVGFDFTSVACFAYSTVGFGSSSFTPASFIVIVVIAASSVVVVAWVAFLALIAIIKLVIIIGIGLGSSLTAFHNSGFCFAVSTFVVNRLNCDYSYNSSNNILPFLVY